MEEAQKAGSEAMFQNHSASLDALQVDKGTSRRPLIRGLHERPDD
jgi:hypothetical protein